jgi:hypothetical protein
VHILQCIWKTFEKSDIYGAKSLTKSPLVIGRPEAPVNGGAMPTVDLVLGYRKSNQPPILKLLLLKVHELIARASKKAH